MDLIELDGTSTDEWIVCGEKKLPSGITISIETPLVSLSKDDAYKVGRELVDFLNEEIHFSFDGIWVDEVAGEEVS